MNDTFVTVAGVVASDPRPTEFADATRVTSFRLVSTSRRFDRSAGDWADGDTLWVTVTCRRALGENALASLRKRDRVVVHGRLRLRAWTSREGEQRSTVEVAADAVGHDLGFGTSRFTRVRPAATAGPPGAGAGAEEAIPAGPAADVDRTGGLAEQIVVERPQSAALTA